MSNRPFTILKGIMLSRLLFGTFKKMSYMSQPYFHNQGILNQKMIINTSVKYNLIKVCVNYVT